MKITVGVKTPRTKVLRTNGVELKKCAHIPLDYTNLENSREPKNTQTHVPLPTRTMTLSHSIELLENSIVLSCKKEILS